jgi:hypothetical protein
MYWMCSNVTQKVRGFRLQLPVLKLARRIDFKHISTPEEGFNLDDADPVKLMVDKAEGSYLWVQLNIAAL